MPSRHSVIVRLGLLAGVVVASQAAVRVHGAQPAELAVGDPGLPTLPPDMPKGYLPPAALPDSLALLPPPPSPYTPGFARDEAVRQAAEKLRGTARWTFAAGDAVLRFPQAAGAFACAAALPIGEAETPHLHHLLGRTLIDVGLSTYRAKNHYRRIRPFAMHREASCTPAEEALLSTDGSYPSGHSAAGWGWALLLAEIAPDRADAILRRGRDFGDDRLVCDVHWQSDVDAGRVIAAATIARLHADRAFAADLAAAKAEVAALPQSREPAARCAAEAAALAIPL